MYLCGLELQGAAWDAQHGAIKATDSRQTSSMPLVCVEVKFKSLEAEEESFHPEADSPSTTPELSLYNCPLCIDTELEGQWEQAIASDGIIATVPLQTMTPAALCSLQRVKIVSVLW